MPADLWAAFVELRLAKRAPLTGRAVATIARKLVEYAAQGMASAAVLEQAIERGWTTVYPLKGDRSQQGDPPSSGIRTWL